MSLGLFLPQHRSPQNLLSQSSGYIIFRASGFKIVTAENEAKQGPSETEPCDCRGHAPELPPLFVHRSASDARPCRGLRKAQWSTGASVFPELHQREQERQKGHLLRPRWGGEASFAQLQLREKLAGGGEGGSASVAQRCTFLLGLGCKKEGSWGGRQGLSSALGCRMVSRFEPETEGQVARSRGAGCVPLPGLAVASPAGPVHWEH